MLAICHPSHASDLPALPMLLLCHPSHSSNLPTLTCDRFSTFDQAGALGHCARDGAPADGAPQLSTQELSSELCARRDRFVAIGAECRAARRWLPPSSHSGEAAVGGRGGRGLLGFSYELEWPFRSIAEALGEVPPSHSPILPHMPRPILPIRIIYRHLLVFEQGAHCKRASKGCDATEGPSHTPLGHSLLASCFTPLHYPSAFFEIGDSQPTLSLSVAALSGDSMSELSLWRPPPALGWPAKALERAPQIAAKAALVLLLRGRIYHQRRDLKSARIYVERKPLEVRGGRALVAGGGKGEVFVWARLLNRRHFCQQVVLRFPKTAHPVHYAVVLRGVMLNWSGEPCGEETRAAFVIRAGGGAPTRVV